VEHRRFILSQLPRTMASIDTIERSQLTLATLDPVARAGDDPRATHALKRSAQMSRQALL